MRAARNSQNVSSQAAGDTGHAPQKHTECHQARPAHMITEVTENGSEDDITRNKSSDDPAALGIAQSELRANAGQNCRDNIAIEIVENVDYGKQEERAPGHGAQA